MGRELVCDGSVSRKSGTHELGCVSCVNSKTFILSLRSQEYSSLHHLPSTTLASPDVSRTSSAPCSGY